MDQRTQRVLAVLAGYFRDGSRKALSFEDASRLYGMPDGASEVLLELWGALPELIEVTVKPFGESPIGITGLTVAGTSEAETPSSS